MHFFGECSPHIFPRKYGLDLLLKIRGLFCTLRHSTSLQSSKSTFIFSHLWQKFWEKCETLFAFSLIPKVVCFTFEGSGVRHVAPDYKVGVYYCVLYNRLHGGTAESRIKLPTSRKALFKTSSQLNTAHLLSVLLVWKILSNYFLAMK